MFQLPVKVAQEHPSSYDKQTDLKDFCSSLFTEIDQGNIGCKTLYISISFRDQCKVSINNQIWEENRTTKYKIYGGNNFNKNEECRVYCQECRVFCQVYCT